MERTERTQERTKPFFPPAFQALSKYYWRELLHLSSAVDQKVQRGVSDDYRKILQRDFAAIPRIMFFALADTLYFRLMNGIDLFTAVTSLGENGFKDSEQFVHTINGFGKDTRASRFSYPARSAKQISMSQFLGSNCIFQRSSQRPLPHHRFERGRTVFTG